MIVSSSLISVLVFCFQVAGYSRKVQAKRRSPYTQEEAHWLADEGSGCPLDDPDCFDRQMSSGDNRLDYPPVAVVERDMSIDWLQLKPVILYGNASTDDHGIVSYLWAKLQGGAVTMQGIHTPFLHISDLERDAYIFSLTVTDTNDQQSSDVARVFVRGAGSFDFSDNDDSLRAFPTPYRPTRPPQSQPNKSGNQVPELLVPSMETSTQTLRGMANIAGCQAGCDEPEPDPESDEGGMDIVTMSIIIAVSALVFIITCLSLAYVIHRLKKKDEGSYSLGEPKRSPLMNQYSKTPPKEFFA